MGNTNIMWMFALYGFGLRIGSRLARRWRSTVGPTSVQADPAG